MCTPQRWCDNGAVRDDTHDDHEHPNECQRDPNKASAVNS
jgi:hypothetical protein